MALESKCTLLSAQKRTPIFCLAPKRAQEIAQKSKSLKRPLKRVGFSEKCSGEWVTQKRGRSKEFATQLSDSLKRGLKRVPWHKKPNETNCALKFNQNLYPTSASKDCYWNFSLCRVDIFICYISVSKSVLWPRKTNLLHKVSFSHSPFFAADVGFDEIHYS